YRAFCDEISSNHWPFHDFRYNSLSFIPKYWTIPHAISLCSLAVSISGLPVDSDNISVVGSIEIGKDIETVVANILLPLIESEKKGEEERKKEDVEEEEEDVEILSLSSEQYVSSRFLFNFLEKLFVPDSLLLSHIKRGVVINRTILRCVPKHMKDAGEVILDRLIQHKESEPSFVRWLVGEWLITQIRSNSSSPQGIEDAISIVRNIYSLGSESLSSE
ncbi:hypothetical protein ADUPG1_001452, partial [Aduncisulcus paluster]